jgi:DNA-binding CsgD family transcriptional regulator/ribosomal protein L14E/L6E/L27E
MRNLIPSLVLLCILNIQLKAESLNITSFGKLFVSNFSPNLYQAENQNWDICMGENGLIYIANGPLLEGGSEYWRKHYIPGDKYIRSVHALKGDRILIGANEEIGIYSRSEIPGETNYQSLLDKLDPQFHSFGYIWQIIENKGDYFLRAGKGVFKYDNDSIYSLMYGDIIDYIQIIDDKFFVLVAGKGLGLLKEGKFTLLNYGEAFADKKIMAITPYNSSQEYLIFTDDDGVFKTDKETVALFNAFSKPEITESQINTVIALENMYYAIGTVKDGLFVLNSEGNIIQHLNKKNGLQNNTIISMYADISNNIWLGLDYGISYVYLNSCLSIINSEGDVGTGYVSKYFNGKLYLGTNQGLYYMDWDNKNKKRMGDMLIHPVKNSSGQVWELTESNGMLLCGHHKGLFLVKEDSASLISPFEGSWKFEALISIPDHYVQSTYRGFYLYKIKENKNFEVIHKLDEIDNSRKFIQDSRGNIWIRDNKNQLVMFTIDPVSKKVSGKKVFSSENGFDHERFRIVGNRHQAFFSTEKGIYGYNYETDQFESKSFYNEILDTSSLITEFFEDDYNRIWYVSESEMGYFSLNFGQMEKTTWPFNIVNNFYNHTFGKINVISKEDVLFGVDRGFYHFNANCNSGGYKNYISYIIDLQTYSPPKKIKKHKSGISYPVYPNKKNSFEFLFTSNIIESQEDVYFKFMLEGYDDDWSEWTLRNIKEYNNLFEGVYTLHVKAIDKSGRESSDSTFTFQVKPPNYRSVFAYLIYVILIIIFSLVLRRIRLKKLEAEKQKIELRKQKELEEKRKKYEESQLRAKQKITELGNEKLHQDLKHKSKELSNSMINILHKNEILLNLKNEMQELYLERNLQKRDFNIKKLIHVIDNEISTKKDLEVFDSNFNAVHEEFLKNLKEKYPNLNQNDHRLCTFIKMNKSTKEIATFLNMSIRGVETSRYRLRKKMGLESDVNLYDVISDI